MDKKSYILQLLKYFIMAVIVGIIVGAIDALFGRVLIAISDFRTIHYQYLLPFLPIAGLVITAMYYAFSKASLKEIYNYDVISNIESRIKTPDSIVKKMKKKNYDLNYEELIKNINDVAGIRIVCPFKTDIFKIKEVIEKNSNLEILEVKDYVNTPKKSGYSGLHIIAQTPVNIGDTVAQVKVEIQIRTMAMDFWSTTEHKIKYKAKNKLSIIDSIKMVQYAKIVNKLDEKITKINSKYIG